MLHFRTIDVIIYLGGDMMSITGERLKKQRKIMDMSADDIALELGVSRSTIFRYENGSIEKVPANILEKLADILNTTPAYLMGWTDDSHDWERVGNNEGISLPKDYEGSYEDYVKYKMYETQDALMNITIRIPMRILTNLIKKTFRLRFELLLEV